MKQLVTLELGLEPLNRFLTKKAVKTTEFKSMCKAYKEIPKEQRSFVDPPVLFLSEKGSWAWAWGGDCGRLNELEGTCVFSMSSDKVGCCVPKLEFMQKEKQEQLIFSVLTRI
jgi:hypothetical protein